MQLFKNLDIMGCTKTKENWSGGWHAEITWWTWLIGMKAQSISNGGYCPESMEQRLGHTATLNCIDWKSFPFWGVSPSCGMILVLHKTLCICWVLVVALNQATSRLPDSVSLGLDAVITTRYHHHHLTLVLCYYVQTVWEWNRRLIGHLKKVCYPELSRPVESYWD